MDSAGRDLGGEGSSTAALAGRGDGPDAIRADVNAGGADALKVFISYARVDAAHADTLVEALEAAGVSVAIDRRDLPYGEQWQGELADLIADSDTVVWLVSPDSARSKWCNWELGEVSRLSKRLVPVRIRETDPAALPEALGRLHLLPAEGLYDAARHQADLVATLNTDRAWLKKGTDLGRIAREWTGKERDRALLLRGRALTEAESWSTRRPGAAPAPSSEVLALILASRAARRRLQRYTVAGSVTAATIAIGLAIAAVWFGIQARSAAAEAERQRTVAQDNETRARAQETEANRQRQAAQKSETLAKEQRNAALSSEVSRVVATAKPYLTSGRADIAMGLALDVASRSPDDDVPLSRDLELVLRRALVQTPAPVERHAVDNAYRVAVSHDGRLLAVGTAGSSRGVVHIFDAQTMTERVRFQSQSAGENVSSMAFSSDDRNLAVAGGTTPGVWDVETGKLRFRLQYPEGVRAFTKMVAYSPDGDYLVLSSNANVALVYDAATGQLRHTLPGTAFEEMMGRVEADSSAFGASDPIVWNVSQATFAMFGGALDIAISPDSSTIAVTSQSRPDGSVQLFDARTGALKRLLVGGWNNSMIGAMAVGRILAFSPDGTKILASPFPQTIKAWAVADGRLLAESPARDVSTFVTTEDGRALISGHNDGALVFRCMEGLLETTRLQAHSASVEALAVDYVDRLLVSTSSDGTAKVWRLPSSAEVCDDATVVEGPAALSATQPYWTLAGHRAVVLDAAISPDGMSVYSGSQDGVVRAWRLPRTVARATRSGFHGSEAVDDLGHLMVASADESTVFVSGDVYGDFAAFDVASGAVTDLADVAGVSASSSDGRPRLFRSVLTFWSWGREGPEGKEGGGYSTAWKGVVSRDGRRAVTTIEGHSGEDDVPVLFDVENRRQVRVLEAGDRKASAYGYYFSPDGRLVFANFQAAGDTASGDGFGAWDAETGEQRAFLPGIEGYGSDWKHHFSADGGVVMLENNSRLKVFRLTKDTLEPVAVAGARASVARALMPDGSAILEAHEDGTVTMVPIPPAGGGIRTFRVAGDPLKFLAVSPDGNYAAAGDMGRTLTVFQLADGAVLQTLPLQEKPFGVAFLPKRQRLAIADVDGNLRSVPIVPALDGLPDGRSVVDWLRATRHSVVTDGDRALFGLTGVAKHPRPDLASLPRFAVPPKANGPAPNDLAAACDRLAANPFDRDRRAPGIIFERLDAAPAMETCEKALASAPEDRTTRYQVARLHDRLGELRVAADGYRIAAGQGSAVAMRGIARLLQISKDDLGVEGSASEWMDRAAHGGDPWAIATLATDMLADDGGDAAIAKALGMLEAAEIPNRAQASITLGLWLNRKGPATLERAMFMSLLGLELNDTMADPAPNTEASAVQLVVDLVRDRGPQMAPADLIALYRRARDWRAP